MPSPTINAAGAGEGAASPLLLCAGSEPVADALGESPELGACHRRDLEPQQHRGALLERDRDHGPAAGAREGAEAERRLVLDLQAATGLRLAPRGVDVGGPGGWGDEGERDRAGAVVALQRAAHAGPGRARRLLL